MVADRRKTESQLIKRSSTPTRIFTMILGTLKQVRLAFTTKPEKVISVSLGERSPTEEDRKRFRNQKISGMVSNGG